VLGRQRPRVEEQRVPLTAGQRGHLVHDPAGHAGDLVLRPPGGQRERGRIVRAAVQVAHGERGRALQRGAGRQARADRHVAGQGHVEAGTVAGLAGSLFAFAKGTISPETLGVGKSVDGLVMVLLGGVHALSGPWVGAALFTWLQDTVARQTDYWRALLGVVMLALILVFPLGVAGGLKRLFLRDASAA
jgi:hypothetical protein